jgi:hypothetical protein
LTDQLAEEVEKVVGPVKYVVSPNKIHWLFMKQWQQHFPHSKLYASPGLQNRTQVAKDLVFTDSLTSEAPAEWASEIDQVVFEGGVMDEVWFFHKASKTVLVCDMIQRQTGEIYSGWQRWIMKADGMSGPFGSTPKEWRFAFWAYGLLPKTRKTLNKVLNEWQPEKMIIAHGMNAEQGAAHVIKDCLPWIPNNPREPCFCCNPGPSNMIDEEFADVKERNSLY